MPRLPRLTDTPAGHSGFPPNFDAPAGRAEFLPNFDAAAWPGGAGMYRRPSWIAAMASRIGEPRTLLTSDDAGSSAALLCFRNDDPEAYEAYNLGALALRVPPVFEWSDAGVAELAALRAVTGSPGESGEAALFPNFTAVLPGYQDSVVWSGPRGKELAADILATFTRAGETGDAAATAVLYVSRDAQPTTSVLAGLGYHRFPLTSRAVLTLGSPGIDGYLDSLSPHRRRRVRSELRALRSAGITSELTDPPTVRDLIVRLRLEHLRKLGQRADPQSEQARLDLLLNSFPADDVRCVVTRQSGRPIGVCLLIHAATTPSAATSTTAPDVILHCVLSATAADAPPLTHFETTFYAPVSLAATAPTRIDYGIGHLRGKTLRGCALDSLDGWARAFDPAVDRLLMQAARLACLHNLEANGAEDAAAAPQPIHRSTS